MDTLRSYISWRGERSILYKGVETSPYQTHFKNLVGKPERESPKRIISASGGLRLLQMILKSNTGWCASEDAKPQRGVNTRRCASEDVGLRMEVDCEIPH